MQREHAQLQRYKTTDPETELAVEDAQVCTNQMGIILCRSGLLGGTPLYPFPFGGGTGWRALSVLREPEIGHGSLEYGA